jgi:hypothetical protein
MKVFCLLLLLACAAPALAADTTAPDPPAAVQAQYVPNYITLTWSASPSADVAQYRVYTDSGCDVLPGCEPTLEATRAPLDELSFTGPYGERASAAPALLGDRGRHRGQRKPGAGPSLVGVASARPRSSCSPRPRRIRRAGEVAFSWTMPGAATARLTIVDLAGRTVRLLAGGTRAAGPQGRTWDGRDARGQMVRPGAYFARLDSRVGQQVADAGQVQ